MILLSVVHSDKLPTLSLKTKGGNDTFLIASFRCRLNNQHWTVVKQNKSQEVHIATHMWRMADTSFISHITAIITFLSLSSTFLALFSKYFFLKSYIYSHYKAQNVPESERYLIQSHSCHPNKHVNKTKIL